MSSSPIVQLDVDAFERSHTIFTDYVDAPSRSIDRETLERQLSGSVMAIKRRLGGALTDKILKLMHQAFSFETQSFENHGPWIRSLLDEYYDRAYDHSCNRNQRKVAFKGNYEECHQW